MAGMKNPTVKLACRPAVCAFRTARTQPRVSRAQVAMRASAQENKLTDKATFDAAVIKAKELEANSAPKEQIATAWKEVEQLSANYAQAAAADPLEVYCTDNPETDECRVYED